MSFAVFARPAADDNIIFEDNIASVPIASTTLPPFPTLSPRFSLGMRPEELNSLMLLNEESGYVYNRPETPFEEPNRNEFEGYFYDRPKNPMILPTSSTTTRTTTEAEEEIIDLPDGAARILK